MTPVRIGTVFAALLSMAAIAWAGADKPQVIVIKAARIHTVSGDPIEGGMIVIRDGRIEAVGRELAIPTGARVLDLAGSVVTPGLIDACCAVDCEVMEEASGGVYLSAQPSFWNRLADRVQHQRDNPEHVGTPLFDDLPTFAGDLAFTIPASATWSEEVSEVTPHRRVIDSINLLSHDFARLMKGGVTTVYVSADSTNVIGSRGAIVKTAGPLANRIVRPADAVKATMGGDPSQRGQSNVLPPPYGPAPSFHTRRPTTRMGVDWVFRKSFYDARRARAGLELHGADMPPSQAIPVLQDILDGKVPLRIQARMQHDIFSALRLADEFNLKFTLEEATEAYRCLPQLKAVGVPVIFGPIFMTPTGYRGLTDEVKRARLNSPKQIADAGIELALTAQEMRDEEGLVRQGMVAVQNGLPADKALRAITSTPAAMLGLASELGTVTPGARADLVVWSAEPFDATSRPLVVLIDGRIVYDVQQE